MGDTVQSVVIGESVYIGGGSTLAYNEHNNCTVMKLDLQRDEWTMLPQYSAAYFAMTSIENQLVLVGGRDPRPWIRKLTNQIGVFASGKWTHPYPPMNIARQSSTAVCFNNYIIVAGGWYNQNKHIRTFSVEVLDVASTRWYIAESLPIKREDFKSTLIGHTLYLMGGYDHTGPNKVHKVDLNELITRAVSEQTTHTLWQVIEDTPLDRSAPLNVGGSLLAIGGCDDHHSPSSFIHLYQPDTRRWVKVGDLPTAQYDCTCSVLPSGEVIVAGGGTGPWDYISTVNFMFIS